MESSTEEMIVGNCGVGISLEYYDGIMMEYCATDIHGSGGCNPLTL